MRTQIPTIAEQRDYNTCAERNIKRLDSAITRLKQLKEMIAQQQKALHEDEGNPCGLRYHDLNGYGNSIQGVEELLHTASLDLIGVAVNWGEHYEAQKNA